MMNKKNNLPESEICFALTALLVNFSLMTIVVGVLWYLVSQITQNLPLLIMTNEIR